MEVIHCCKQRDRDGERMLTSYLKLLFSLTIVGSSETIKVCFSLGSGHSPGHSTAPALEVILHDFHIFQDFFDTFQRANSTLVAECQHGFNTQGTEGSCGLPLDVSRSSSSPSDPVCRVRFGVCKLLTF